MHSNFSRVAYIVVSPKLSSNNFWFLYCSDVVFRFSYKKRRFFIPNIKIKYEKKRSTSASLFTTNSATIPSAYCSLLLVTAKRCHSFLQLQFVLAHSGSTVVTSTTVAASWPNIYNSNVYMIAISAVSIPPN